MVYKELLAPAARPLALLLLVGMCACSTRGGPVTAGGGGGTTDVVASDFAPTGYCPPVQIRPQTEVMSLYERGHEGEPAFVRYQASITRTARECHTAGATLSIKVGISGRVVAGPKGGPGSVSLPVRVAVVKQLGDRGPLYSQLFKVPVTVTGPTFGTDFNEVFEQVNVELTPEDRDLIVFVGYDEGPS